MGETVKQYILTGESAKKFMDIKNHNEEKLKERIELMRNFNVKPVQKVVPETTLKSITCDMCGTAKEMEYEYIENEFQNIKFSFGYGSKFDGEHWRFDLCDDCVEKLVKSLKHAPCGIESLETDERQMSQEEFDRWKTDNLLPYNGVWADDEDDFLDED